MSSAAVCQVYYVYGFALLVTLILLIVVVCVSIVGTYFLLNAGVTALLVCGTCFLMQSPRKYDVDAPRAFVLLGSRGAQQRSAQDGGCWCWHSTASSSSASMPAWAAFVCGLFTQVAMVHPCRELPLAVDSPQHSGVYSRLCLHLLGAHTVDASAGGRQSHRHAHCNFAGSIRKARDFGLQLTYMSWRRYTTSTRRQR